MSLIPPHIDNVGITLNAFQYLEKSKLIIMALEIMFMNNHVHGTTPDVTHLVAIAIEHLCLRRTRHHKDLVTRRRILERANHMRLTRTN